MRSPVVKVKVRAAAVKIRRKRIRGGGTKRCEKRGGREGTDGGKETMDGEGREGIEETGEGRERERKTEERGGERRKTEERVVEVMMRGEDEGRGGRGSELEGETLSTKKEIKKSLTGREIAIRNSRHVKSGTIMRKKNLQEDARRGEEGTEMVEVNLKRMV